MQTLESQVSEAHDWVVLVNSQDTNPYTQFVERHGSLISFAEDFRHTVREGKKVIFQDSTGRILQTLTTLDEIKAWENDLRDTNQTKAL